MSVEDAVLEAMKQAGKPVRNADLQKLTDLSSAEITKVIKKLKDEGKVNSPKRCFYRLA